MGRKVRGAALGVAATLFAAYLTGAALIRWSPDRFVGFPEPEVPQTPGAVGLRYADVWLEVGWERALVHGWWVPKGEGAPVVLLLHGTGRTIRGVVHVAAALHDAGAAVLMIDYRGLGRSDRGLLTEASMYEDATTAWQHMRWFQGDPTRCLVYGHSLGAAIALELAARNPDVAGVIIEGAPTSMRDLLARSLLSALFPVEWLLRGRFDAAAKLARVRAPILVIHGKDDPIVPPTMAVELHRRANEPKALLMVERAGHSDAALRSASEYRAAIARLLPPLPALAGDRPSTMTLSRAGPAPAHHP
jgi:pimeloyl-ACP methyl ester carboxylesterase